LTRLRQICCHPALIDDTFSNYESEKLTLLYEMITQCHEANHKIVIFSQFIGIISIVGKWLNAQKINHAVLTGQSKNRKEIITEFNENPQIRIFLISLKTGGVGINLTAADYVFHFDPRWNPAIESQATDRVHRIGQEKPIFVYKMFTRNTVEDKIFQIQKRKEKLIEDVLKSAHTGETFLTKDDVDELLAYTKK